MRFEPGDLARSDRVENIRRSLVMLPPFAPALTREEAIEVLEALLAALNEGRDGQ